MITKYLFLRLIIQSTILISTISMASFVEDFVGEYKATCEGKGPNDLSGQWVWTLTATHIGDEGVIDPASVSIYESSPNSDHIWLVTFMKPNQPATEEAEDGVNVTTYFSTLKDQTLQGAIDSYAYARPDRPLPPIFQAHWQMSFQMGAKSGVFSLKYKGYDLTQDPDYSFSCALERE